MTASIQPDRQRLLAACQALEGFLGRSGYLGYDPYDVLKSPPLLAFAKRSRRFGQLATAGVRLAPMNVRPLFGVRRSRNSKALALLILAAQARYQQSGHAGHLALARRLEHELLEKSIPYGEGIGWGYDFPWANRSFFVPARTPNAVVTCMAIDALAAARPADVDRRAAALRFLRQGLNWDGEGGDIHVSYTPADRRDVLNVQALVGRALVLHGGPDEALLGSALAERVARLQGSDGSWPYGSSSNDSFIDFHHTGFVLRSLRDINMRRPSPALEASIERGLTFLEASLLRPDGAPRSAPDRDFPVDIHAWAEAVLVGCAFARPWRSRVLEWGLTTMRNPDGSFIYQQRPFMKLRTPYLRWGQAWSYLALVTALEQSE